MSDAHPPRPLRPWYCPDDAVDFYKILGRRYGVSLKALKIGKAVMTNAMVAGVAAYAIAEGAEPTTVGTAAVVALALLNGVELSEWLAAKQALKELDEERKG